LLIHRKTPRFAQRAPGCWSTLPVGSRRSMCAVLQWTRAHQHGRQLHWLDLGQRHHHWHLLEALARPHPLLGAKQYERFAVSNFRSSP
jgi:hypothetical protein